MDRQKCDSGYRQAEESNSKAKNTNIRGSFDVWTCQRGLFSNRLTKDFVFSLSLSRQSQ